jgi:hypothetical protein
LFRHKRLSQDSAMEFNRNPGTAEPSTDQWVRLWKKQVVGSRVEDSGDFPDWLAAKTNVSRPQYLFPDNRPGAFDGRSLAAALVECCSELLASLTDFSISSSVGTPWGAADGLTPI